MAEGESIGLDWLTRALQAAPLGLWVRGTGLKYGFVIPDKRLASHSREARPETTEFDPTDVQPEEVEFYRPVRDEPDLFLTFAEHGNRVWNASDPWKELGQATLDLVRQYGILWYSYHRTGRWPNLADTWSECRLLSLAADCHRAFTQDDQFVRDRFLRRVETTEFQDTFDDFAPPDSFRRFLIHHWPGDVSPDDSLFGQDSFRSNASRWLRWLINERLHHHEVTALLILKDAPQGTLWDRGFRVSSLAAALWVQMYVAVLQQSLLKTCLWCGREFGTELQRKVYCSDSCKNRAKSSAYRKRKRNR